MSVIITVDRDGNPVSREDTIRMMEEAEHHADERCPSCHHLWEDHVEDTDDGESYCVGNLRENSTQLPTIGYAPLCVCRQRYSVTDQM